MIFTDNPNSNKKDQTVGELIEVLKTLDPDAPVRIAVQTYTQVYPSGYFMLTTGESFQNMAHDGSARLYIHLGEGFIVSKRKAK